MPYYFDLNFGPLGDTLILVIAAGVIAHLTLIIQPFGTVDGNNNWSTPYNADCGYDWDLETYQPRRTIHPMECADNHRMQAYLFKLTIIPSNIISTAAFIATISLRNCYQLYVVCIVMMTVQTLILMYGMHMISNVLVDNGRIVTRTHVSWIHFLSISILVLILHLAAIVHGILKPSPNKHNHGRNSHKHDPANNASTPTTYADDGPSTPLLRLC